MNMLMTEWKMEDALAFRYNEGREEGREEGIEKGVEKVARNALAHGMSPELVQTITGLDIENIHGLLEQPQVTL